MSTETRAHPLAEQVTRILRETELDRFPPPVATAKARSVGRWTYSSVRDILSNPKYTGYMVGNRKATSSAEGRNNPPEAWVWSSEPTHQGLVSVETFVEAQKIAMLRNRSRSRRRGRVGGEAANEPYVLRSYITCVQCERRMFGKNDRGRIYYVCSPKRSHLPEGHPAVVRLPEQPLMKGLSQFFNLEVFGAQRRERLQTLVARLDDRHLREHEAHVSALETRISDLGR